MAFPENDPTKSLTWSRGFIFSMSAGKRRSTSSPCNHTAPADPFRKATASLGPGKVTASGNLQAVWIERLHPPSKPTGMPASIRHQMRVTRASEFGNDSQFAKGVGRIARSKAAIGQIADCHPRHGRPGRFPGIVSENALPESVALANQSAVELLTPIPLIDLRGNSPRLPGPNGGVAPKHRRTDNWRIVGVW